MHTGIHQNASGAVSSKVPVRSGSALERGSETEKSLCNTTSDDQNIAEFLFSGVGNCGACASVIRS